MKKSIIIGLATLAISGSALIGSSMYAASTGTTTQTKTGIIKNRGTDIVTSLSGKVSTEAITALQTLMTKHQTEMNALKDSSTTLDRTAMEVKHEAFKTEMDALIVKYPELKTAIESGRPMGGKIGRWGRNGENPMKTVLTSLPAEAQAQIESIRTNYRTQFETLRTAEEKEVEAIITKYPEAKAAYDTAKANRPAMGEMGGPRWGHDE
jgi:hypothetical protein